MFFLVLQVGLVIFCVRLLMETENPHAPAAAYTIVASLLRLARGTPLSSVVIFAAVVYAVTLAYFWLLNLFEEGSGTWWAVLIVGMVLGMAAI